MSAATTPRAGRIDLFDPAVYSADPRDWATLASAVASATRIVCDKLPLKKLPEPSDPGELAPAAGVAANALVDLTRHLVNCSQAERDCLDDDELESAVLPNLATARAAWFKLSDDCPHWLLGEAACRLSETDRRPTGTYEQVLAERAYRLFYTTFQARLPQVEPVTPVRLMSLTRDGGIILAQEQPLPRRGRAPAIEAPR